MKFLAGGHDREMAKVDECLRRQLLEVRISQHWNKPREAVELRDVERRSAAEVELLRIFRVRNGACLVEAPRECEYDERIL